MSVDHYTDFNKRLQLMNKGRANMNNRIYLNHHKQVQDFLDSYKTRHASVEFRRKALLNQKKMNYQIEYDRIRNLLHNSRLIPDTTKEMMQKRAKELAKLGAKAINSIQD